MPDKLVKTNPIPEPTPSELARFWAKVGDPDPASGCTEWIASTQGQGYGRFRCGVGMRAAHRVAYTIRHGAIPDGMVIDHLCRNPPCVNPDHLEAVTHKVNTLRGNGSAAQQSRKTHCTHGHEFTQENTYHTPSGGRRCRTCYREYMRGYTRPSMR